MMTDPIADMLTRIRNGHMAKLLYVSCPYSNLKKNILNVLKDEGYIKDFVEQEGEDKFKELEITLKYSNRGEPGIKEIHKVSKPGRRMYTSIEDLKPYYNNMGISIISTSKGVISDNKAKQLGVGGEVICQVF